MADSMSIPEVDWTKFDGDPEFTCYCRCGTIFRSHVKYHFSRKPEDSTLMTTRKPCPGCGSTHDLFRSSSDREKFTL